MKKTLIGIGSSLAVALIIFLATSFRNDIIHETQQDNILEQHSDQIKIITLTEQEKNKAVNLRIDKQNDKDRTEHQKIIDKVDSTQKQINQIKVGQAEIKGMLKMLIKNYDYAQK